MQILYGHNRVTLTNVTLSNNRRGGLYVMAYQSYIQLSSVTVSNNTGSGIFTKDSGLVFTGGHSIIANNSSPTDGGGIYLDGSGGFVVQSGYDVCISFIGNTAQRYGGAVYSSQDNNNLISHPTSRPRPTICSIQQITCITAFNNSAGKAGDTLYGGTFLACGPNHNKDAWPINVSGIISCLNVPYNLTHSISAHPLSPVSSNPILVCPCVNGAVDCAVRLLDREVYPGQISHISVVTVGLCGGVSPGILTIKHDDIDTVKLTLTDGISMSSSCTTINYTVQTTTYVSRVNFTIDVIDGDNNIGRITISDSILPCPLGLMLDSISGDCVCDDNIVHKLSGVTCNINWMPYPIQRSGNNWISRQDVNCNCTIAYIGCPFDYCNTLPVKINLINQSDIDLQCNYNRSGILCGQCQPGLSLMLGSNRCSDCTDTSTYITISLIILMMLAGIGLVVAVKLFDLTISDGSINGLLFYAYIVKLNESVLFPQGSVLVISQFIAWINLDLGFEYCFINGLDGYWKMWLQFVFPLYLWSFVIVIIIACRYSGKVSRLWSRGDNSVSALATLILMPYTKVLRNITNAFFPSITSHVVNTRGKFGV